MKIGFYTFGCKVNQSESEFLIKKLSLLGASVFNLNFEEPLFLDFVVINSCSVTEKASLKSLQKIKFFKKKYPFLKVIFTGCLSQIEEEKIKRWGADFVVKDKNEIGKKSFWDNLGAKIKENSKINLPIFHTRYFLKVQDGCANFCTYCIVPYTRGFQEKSKPPSVAVEEIIKENPGEVVLCGINLGHYKSQENGKIYRLSDLLEKILDETKVRRIRISSVNPEDIDLKLVDLMKKNSRLAPHLHISIQSGSDKILEKMNRRYKRKDVVDLINFLKSEIPDLNITSDMIVGFPGESDDDFKKTLDLVLKLPFLNVHVFPFSPRPKTAAFLMDNQIPNKIKKERVKILNEAQKKRGEMIKKSYIFRNFDVLFEEKKGYYYSGLTGNYLRVYKKSSKNLTNLFEKALLKKIFKDGFIA